MKKKFWQSIAIVFIGLIKWIRIPFKKYREYSDKKFRERVDRVYFNMDKHGNRFFKGRLHAFHDEVSGADGSLTAWANIKQGDIAMTLSVPQSQFAEALGYSSQQECLSNPELEAGIPHGHL